MTSESKNKVLTREEVKEDETWRLEDIFETDEAWEQEYKAIEEFVKKRILIKARSVMARKPYMMR